MAHRKKWGKGMSFGTVKCLAVACLVAALATPVYADDTGLAASLHSLQKERGKTCMIDHFHFGKSSTFKEKRRAKADAIVSWREFVAWEYGTDWGSYRRAGNKSMVCKTSGGMWTCSVKARACRRR